MVEINIAVIESLLRELGGFARQLDLVPMVDQVWLLHHRRATNCVCKLTTVSEQLFPRHSFATLTSNAAGGAASPATFGGENLVTRKGLSAFRSRCERNADRGFCSEICPDRRA